MTTSVDRERAFRSYVEAVVNARAGKTTKLVSPFGNVYIVNEKVFEKLEEKAWKYDDLSK
jgi:hypothetical protein